MRPQGTRIVDRRRVIVLPAIVLVVGLAVSDPVVAQVRGYFDLLGNARDTETETEDGRVETSRSGGWIWRFNIDYRRLLTPNLSWRLGGWFEQDRSTTEIGDATFDFARKRFRPFAFVNLRNEMSFAEFFWERRDESFEFDDTPDVKQTQDTTRLSLGWVPDETVMPSARVQLERRRRYDEARAFQDLTESTIQLISNYRPHESLDVLYRTGFSVLENALDDTEVERTSHNLRVAYGDQFWNNRLTLGGDYNYNYARSETISPGTGEFFDLRDAFAGLSAIDDFPSLGPLASNPALIDGDLLTGAGIDLGLPPVGGDDRPRNIGLDFAVPSEIDAVRVWVDRDLPLTVTSSFSWGVFVSDDNLEWRFVTTVPVAPFDVFENRFEIRFPAVLTRFVKVVVQPLDFGDPDAQNFPSIQVTEMVGGLFRPADDPRVRRSTDSQIVNFAARVRLLPDELLFYDLSTFLSTGRDAPTLTSILNGVTYTKSLGPVYSTTARIAREDNREALGRNHANVGSASLTVAPLDTLRHTVVLSFRDEGGEILDTRDTATVAFTTAATLYRGIELSGSAARSYFRPDVTRIVTISDQIGAALAIAPHPTLTFNVAVSERTVDSTGFEPDSLADPSRSSRRAGVSFRPLRNIYFFASRRVDRIAATDERVQDDFSANWSPFPGGNVRLFFSYSETTRNIPESEDRALVSTLRWNVRRGTFIDLSYRRLRRDTAFELTRQNSYTGNLRVAF